MPENKNRKLKKALTIGAFVVGGTAATIFGINNHNNGEESYQPEPIKKEIVKDDPYGNIKTFESLRSKIKFALAFVENFAPEAYNDNPKDPAHGTWTFGYGTTIKYNSKGGVEGYVKKGEKVTIEKADVYKGRYLTYEVLPDIKSVKVPMDENTMIATCVFRYCVGHKNFKNSQYLKKLNAGASKKELSKCLTGFRQQTGVLNRCYFFAALLENKITFNDLLGLRAEGCYNLDLKDICKCKAIKNKKGQIIRYEIIPDANNFATWDFSDIKQKLEKAKRPRMSRIGPCKMVKEIVPEYIWKEVQRAAFVSAINMLMDDVEQKGDRESAVALGTLERAGLTEVIHGEVNKRWDKLVAQAAGNVVKKA